MSSSHQNLYYKLKEMDLSHFNIDFSDKIEVPSNVKKNMRYLGTEFERVFTSILANKYGLSTKSLLITIKKQTTIKNTKIEIYKDFNIKKINKFNSSKFIENHEYFSNIRLSINEKAEIQPFVKQLLHKINFIKFKPKQYILTKIKFRKSIESSHTGTFAEIDLIIDDKIIDIKTDSVLKLNKDYVVQLLYYYFLLNYTSNFSQDSKSFLNKLKINKICLYYACFDVLIEFDIKKIFKNSSILKELNELIHNSFVSYSFNLKELIHFVVFNQYADVKYFESIQNDINQNHLHLFKRHIDIKLNFEYENINLNLKSERLLQLIKLNLLIYQFKKTHDLNLDVEILIKKYLMVSFRNSIKKDNCKLLTEIKDKHIYMGLLDYSKMINLISTIEYYDTCVEDKKVQKSFKEFYIRNKENYSEKLIDLKSSNIDDFNFFQNNWSILYNEICDQKLNKIIKNNEFEIIANFIAKLLKFEVKPNNYFIVGLDKILFDIRQSYMNDLITKKQFAEKHKLIFKLVEKI